MNCIKGLGVAVKLLEDMIKSRFQKQVNFSHLVNMSLLNINNLEEPVKTTKGDLIVPIVNKKTCYGQVTIRQGQDLSSSDISQVQHLIDLYFSIHVDKWTKDLEKLENQLIADLSLSTTENKEIPFTDYTIGDNSISSTTEEIQSSDPKFILIKSTNTSRSQYVLSYLQEKLNTIGSIPWTEGTVTLDQNQDLSNILLQTLDLNSVQASELDYVVKNWFITSNKMPHVVLFHSLELTEYSNWASVQNKNEQFKNINIKKLDLDRLPIDYNYLKETIDLYLWG